MRRKRITLSSLRKYTPYTYPCTEIIFDRLWDDITYRFVFDFILKHKIRFYISEDYGPLSYDYNPSVRSRVKIQIAKGFEAEAVLLKLSI